MNRIIVALATLTLFAAIIPPVIAQQSPDEPPVSGTNVLKGPIPVREVLPGGLRLIVEERPDTKLVAIDIRVRAGGGRERPGENGVAHFVEHMIFKGSANRASGEIDAEVEKIGGEISAKTTREFTQFSTVVPAERWKDAFGLLAEALLSPAFDPTEVTREAEVIQAEMRVARSDPERAGFGRLASVAYDNLDPAHLPLMGTEEAVAGMRAAALREFHSRWYQPGNMTVVVVGKVTLEEARKFANFVFRQNTRRQSAPTPEATVYVPMRRILRAEPAPVPEQSGREVTTLLIAFRAPSVRLDDSLPVFETLMPALANENRGRFVERLVKKEGVALSIAADFVPGRSMSLILFTVVTRPRLAALAEKSLLDEARRLREDLLTQAETDRAATIALGRANFTGQTVEGRAAWLATMDVAAPLLDPTVYTKRIADIKPVDLNRLIENYLSTLAYAIAEVGPSAPPVNPDEEGTGPHPSSEQDEGAPQ